MPQLYWMRLYYEGLFSTGDYCYKAEMYKRIPTLKVLKCFEAAARHQSFKRAAEELFVTPSAVSHQVKSLEGTLGVKVFFRYNRRIELTPEGAAYLANVIEAFRILDDASRKIGNSAASQVIGLQMFPFLATELVLPKLKAFKDENPHLELSIKTSSRETGRPRNDVDVSICLGQRDLSGYIYEPLIPVGFTPVCSPGFFAQNEFDSIHSIFDAPLIHNAHKLSDWRAMAKQLGGTLENHPGDLTLDSIQATMQAAEEGLGFALMDKKCIPTRIASNTLVAPFDVELDSSYKLYLAYKEKDVHQPEMMTVRAWLKSLFSDLA